MHWTIMKAQVWIMSLALAQVACQGNGGDSDPGVSGEKDPKPTITFVQMAKAVGIDRSNEPASAGPFPSTASADTIAYGGWLADLDGDGQLDYYAVNHSQNPHLSGLFLNNGAGGFGKNLFTVSLVPAPGSTPRMDLSNEMKFVGDLTGDGRVDLYFTGWSGVGVMCVNQGVVRGTDWTGPGYRCFDTTDALDFADVNGDGKIDVLGWDNSNFDVYATYYAHTASYFWRLNNGNPNINTWPTTSQFLTLHVKSGGTPSPPFVDLDGDGVPDKIVGIPAPEGNRGSNETLTSGKQVFLGQVSGSYVQKSATGLEAVAEPIRTIEDVNGDGCLDIGTDATGYRDNLDWYLQGKSGTTCSVTFTYTPRTALPYYPGFKSYDVDIDDSGLLSKIVIIHTGYGTNDGQPGGVSIYRKLPDGGYAVIGPAQNGIQIDGTDSSEFYADNLTAGDWNDDGRIDFAGTGSESISDTDHGHALWTSMLHTSNGWIKVTLPTVTGFFTGTAKIEVFADGAAGDMTRRIAEPITLSTGRTWASRVHHVGIGTSPSVDVRITFPDGKQITQTGVARNSRITIR